MKEAFKFDEYKSCLDWYTTEPHVINWDDDPVALVDHAIGRKNARIYSAEL